MGAKNQKGDASPEKRQTADELGQGGGDRGRTEEAGKLMEEEQVEGKWNGQWMGRRATDGMGQHVVDIRLKDETP